MSITKEQVIDALRTVDDPDFKKDLVTLNMVSDVEVVGNNIRFRVTLTTPACPLKEKIKKDCLNAVSAIAPGYDIDIVMDAQVTSMRNPNINVLPSVKNIICVASGKGGVGKSTVSISLALTLAAQGAKVGLIDADIHGPSIPLMMGVKGKRPEVRMVKDKHYIIPLEAHGIKILSIGLLVDERQAVVWRGPMVTSALKQFVTDCLWGKLDYLVVDMPPGTGDVHLTMAQTVNVSGAVIVTTPQEAALTDARKAVSMFRMQGINVPIFGIVENMSYFTPPELPDNKYYIFGKDGGKRLADEYEAPFLGEIPLIPSIREAGDEGLPAVRDINSPAIIRESFDKIAAELARIISIKAAERAQAQPQEATT